MTDKSQISIRALSIKPSLTLEISAKAKALKAEGKNICSLSAGEPDFDTPEFIVDATLKALKDGKTRYGPAAGDPELREAIAQKQSDINKVPTKTDNVLVTNGGKQAIYNLFQVVLNPGDEVLIPTPYWLSYPEITLLAGAKPIKIKSSTKDKFKIDINSLEEHVTEKTRLLIINSPSNPTGCVLTEQEIKTISDFLRRHPRILLMSDEIYEFLISPNQVHHSFAKIAPDLRNRIFTVNGFAKAWAMTGWRIGYLTGNAEVIKKAIALQSQSTSNVCSFAQKGAIAALQGSKDCVHEMAKIYNKRRLLITERLKKIKHISFVPPNGAFYVFPEINLEEIDSISFCKLALEKVGLAIVPGIAFGDDKCIRISYAASNEMINDGVDRLESLLNDFKKNAYEY